jgi:hypothetical protein
VSFSQARRPTASDINGHRRTSTDIDIVPRLGRHVASPWWRVPLMHSHDDDDDDVFEKKTDSLRVFEFSSSASLRAPV